MTSPPATGMKCFYTNDPQTWEKPEEPGSSDSPPGATRPPDEVLLHPRNRRSPGYEHQRSSPQESSPASLSPSCGGERLALPRTSVSPMLAQLQLLQQQQMIALQQQLF